MNKEKYVLQEVTTPALVREWLDLPKRIYKGNRIVDKRSIYNQRLLCTRLSWR